MLRLVALFAFACTDTGAEHCCVRVTESGVRACLEMHVRADRCLEASCPSVSVLVCRHPDGGLVDEEDLP